MDGNKIYVAVGDNVEEIRSTLSWISTFLRRETILCVIHVHVPYRMLCQPSGFRAPFGAVREMVAKARERKKVAKMLDDYLEAYKRCQVPFEKIIIMKDSVTGGIMELISRRRIQTLVMGAGNAEADDNYLRRCAKPTSRISNYVLQCAPEFCHIWFIRKGHLIFRREGFQYLEYVENLPNRMRYSEPAVYSPSAELVGRSLPRTQSMPLSPCGSSSTAIVEPSSSNVLRFPCKFSQFDLMKATNFFDPSLRIREGYYGNIYKGFLHHSEVAIKRPTLYRVKSTAEFEQEVDVLSKLNHPNLLNIIGTCPDSLAIIYEYLPNGNLEERLSCKDNTPPLPWQTRIRIATDLCSVLYFLHSTESCSVILCSLIPENVLLDANFICKFSVFGELMDTSYIDPEFKGGGHLSPKSDVYSFGIILLRLLTGRPALTVVKDVYHALENGHLRSILDSSAGDWPVVRANHLAYTALKCCQVKAKYRPDLGSEVWSVLKEMMTPCERLSSPLENLIPSYLNCPIFQEIMRDPCIAADGFTYEADAIKEWFEGGHDTSPMTNLKLDSQNLIPNRALRSAIQDWLRQHQHV